MFCNFFIFWGSCRRGQLENPANLISFVLNWACYRPESQLKNIHIYCKIKNAKHFSFRDANKSMIIKLFFAAILSNFDEGKDLEPGF